MSDQKPLTCYNHPNRETVLRCNRCEQPICVQCAVKTPTGYRCKQCVKTQQKVFVTVKWQGLSHCHYHCRTAFCSGLCGNDDAGTVMFDHSFSHWPDHWDWHCRICALFGTPQAFGMAVSCHRHCRGTGRPAVCAYAIDQRHPGHPCQWNARFRAELFNGCLNSVAVHRNLPVYRGTVDLLSYEGNSIKINLYVD